MKTIPYMTSPSKHVRIIIVMLPPHPRPPKSLNCSMIQTMFPIDKIPKRLRRIIPEHENALPPDLATLSTSYPFSLYATTSIRIAWYVKKAIEIQRENFM